MSYGEGAGMVQSGEEKAQGKTHHSLQLLKGGGGQPLLPDSSSRTRGDASCCTWGGSGWALGRISPQKEWWCPGTGCPGRWGSHRLSSVQETWRCGTEGHSSGGRWGWADGWAGWPERAFPTLTSLWFYERQDDLWLLLMDLQWTKHSSYSATKVKFIFLASYHRRTAN